MSCFSQLSSRSHAILQLLVESTERVPAAAYNDGDEYGGGNVGMVTTRRRAKLSLVDLAGSEKMNVAKDAPAMSKRHLAVHAGL